MTEHPPVEIRILFSDELAPSAIEHLGVRDMLQTAAASVEVVRRPRVPQRFREQLTTLSSGTGVLIDDLLKIYELPGTAQQAEKQAPRLRTFTTYLVDRAPLRRAVLVATIMANQLVVVGGKPGEPTTSRQLHDVCRRLKVPTEKRIVQELRRMDGLEVGPAPLYPATLQLAGARPSPAAQRLCQQAVKTLLAAHLS